MNSGGSARAVRLFDAHCHLQDPRISGVSPILIRTSIDSGILHFAVNGVSEKDWHIVKKMGEDYPCVIPNFGLHPWYVTERSAGWLSLLRDLFAATPSAAVGEIGLDKGARGKTIEFADQVEVFRQQLELARELGRPASIHCVRAYGDLLEIMQGIGPFPAGVILHSYMGSAEMVSGFAILGAYFSISGYLTSMKSAKAEKMLKEIPIDRILLESDAPDGLPMVISKSLLPIPRGDSNGNSSPGDLQSQQGHLALDASPLRKEKLNHPANIRTVLRYVAIVLKMQEEELAEVSYQNATRLFSFPGSKVSQV